MKENIRRRSIRDAEEKMIKKLKSRIEDKQAGEVALKRVGTKILGNFNQQLEDYIHFQSAAKQDMSQRVQSQDIKSIFTRDIASIVKGKKEDIGKLLTAIKVDVAKQLQQDTDVDINLNKETEQLVK